MKRKYFVVAAVAALLLDTVSACKEQSRPKFVDDDDRTETMDDEDDDSPRRSAAVFEDDSDASLSNEQHCKDFIKDMYDHQRYEDYDYLQGHCTRKMLDKLSEAYEYDGEGYAVWLFRTSGQDGKPDAEDTSSRILSIEKDSQGSNWYVYEFLDGGWRGKNRIKIIEKENSEFLIDGLERIYDEPGEM